MAKYTYRKEVEAWQNVEGSEIPEWLPVMGAVESGKVLRILGDNDTVLTIQPNQWVTYDADYGHIEHFPPEDFKLIFEKVEEGE